MYFYLKHAKNISDMDPTPWHEQGLEELHNHPRCKLKKERKKYKELQLSKAMLTELGARAKNSFSGTKYLILMKLQN